MSKQTQRPHGGDWTKVKLGCLEGYLTSYATALKNFGFQRVYIDGFSGTGEPYRSGSSPEETNNSPMLIDKDEAEFFDGSVRRALNVQPHFHHVYLIESRRKNVTKLKELSSEPENINRNIHIVPGDANDALVSICRKIDWNGKKGSQSPHHRAVLFLDPFGCQVDWSTIEMVADTKAIDMWYLFPSGWLNRMLPKNKEIPVEWQNRLDKCLGTPEWRDQFFEEIKVPTLFDLENIQKNKTISIKGIEKFFIKRLKSKFHTVCDACVPIENMQGYQMFSLCFAAGNPKGGPIALKIASHLVKNWSRARG